jgi:hypothetical protein
MPPPTTITAPTTFRSGMESLTAIASLHSTSWNAIQLPLRQIGRQQERERQRCQVDIKDGDHPECR